MRNPDRIERILDKLKLYWEEHPDHRLGQIISNISVDIDNKVDPFYMSDDELEEWLREWILDELTKEAQELGLYDNEA